MASSWYRMALILALIGSLTRMIGEARGELPGTEKPEILGQNFGDRPVRVDHRDRQSPVKDQGDRATCLAHAVVACLEAQGDLPRDLSEEMLHHQFVSLNRMEDPKFDADFDGIHIATLVNFHTKYRICEEAWLPYCPKGAPWEVGAEAYEAPGIALSSVERLRRPSIEKLEELLAAGHDIPMQATGDWRVESGTADGVVDLAEPTKFDISHFLLAVGYDRERQVLIVKNSFGAGWGDRGYNYLTYRFVKERCDNAVIVRGAPDTRDVRKVTK